MRYLIVINSRDELRSDLAERLDHNVVSKGRFVMWKPGLKNRKFPDYGEPSIVTAVSYAGISADGVRKAA